jgi:hypothetical protein
MLFQHFSDNDLRLTTLKHRHEPKASCQLLGYADMHGS